MKIFKLCFFIFIFTFNFAFSQTNIRIDEIIEIKIVGKTVSKTYYAAFSKSLKSMVYYDEVY